MKPETALKLVSDYSALTRAIRDCKKELAETLGRCSGPNPPRMKSQGVNDPATNHLDGWYTPETIVDHWGEERLDYLDIGVEQFEECRHCYGAHIIIQKRKALRRRLGSVKAAMTKLGAQ
ncbi:hypothetical protein C4E15_28115 [Achromobacter spanius]|uniref:Uncharacterized protein n=1 Tax=Achromobacter spanius TaxID=217203 RepID=A0A2S5GIF4_9BURK|nr:hypothetical protein [Achromobacter spanius]PPA72832.1 hypothetical protein C4E15_28115 [Achromobacter spanius]